jgi:hypothetical protein
MTSLAPPIDVSKGASIQPTKDVIITITLTAVEAAPAEAERQAERDKDACPGRKPSCWAVKRSARPYKSAIQTRFTVGNAKGA